MLLEPRTSERAGEERGDALRRLASCANAAHASARGAAGAAVAHVMAAGNALSRARELCADGEWGAWLRANFDGSMRTAQRYVRAARCWPERLSDATRVSRGSQRKAIVAVRGLLFAPPKQRASDGIFGTEAARRDAPLQMDAADAPSLQVPFVTRATAILRAASAELEAIAPPGDEAAARLVAAVRELADELAIDCSDEAGGAETLVYFIEAVGADRVKIGVAADPALRMQQLQTSSGHPLALIGSIRGGRAVERALHTRYAAFRISGEWFYLSRYVRSGIERLVS